METIRVTVKYDGKRKEVEVEKGTNVKKLADFLGLIITEHLVKVNDRFVPDTFELTESCEVEFVRIASSG